MALGLAVDLMLMCFEIHMAITGWVPLELLVRVPGMAYRVLPGACLLAAAAEGSALHRRSRPALATPQLPTSWPHLMTTCPPPCLPPLPPASIFGMNLTSGLERWDPYSLWTIAGGGVVLGLGAMTAVGLYVRRMGLLNVPNFGLAPTGTTG